METRIENLQRRLGGVFEDKENTYASFGKDWWSLKYAPKYPKDSPEDIAAYGWPIRRKYAVSTPNEPSGTVRKFSSFEELCCVTRRLCGVCGRGELSKP